MAWWDLTEKSESKIEYLARVKFEEIHSKSVSSFMEIVDCELLPNVQYRIITNHRFNAITVIEYMSKYYELQEVYIAVYRMNQMSVNKLLEFINNDDIKCSIIVSSFFRDNKNYEKWAKDLVSFSSGKSNTKVVFFRNHAKVFLAKTKCGRHIVFEGSGNLSDNARIEQYLIEDNEVTYNFHKEWMDDILKSDYESGVNN